MTEWIEPKQTHSNSSYYFYYANSPLSHSIAWWEADDTLVLNVTVSDTQINSQLDSQKET